MVVGLHFLYVEIFHKTLEPFVCGLVGREEAVEGELRVIFVLVLEKGTAFFIRKVIISEPPL